MKQLLALWALTTAMGFCTAVTRPAIVNTAPVAPDSQFVVMRAQAAGMKMDISDFAARVEASGASADSLIAEQEGGRNP